MVERAPAARSIERAVDAAFDAGVDVVGLVDGLAEALARLRLRSLVTAGGATAEPSAVNAGLAAAAAIGPVGIAALWQLTVHPARAIAVAGALVVLCALLALALVAADDGTEEHIAHLRALHDAVVAHHDEVGAALAAGTPPPPAPLLPPAPSAGSSSAGRRLRAVLASLVVVPVAGLALLWIGLAVWQLASFGPLALLASHGWVAVLAAGRAIVAFDAGTIARGIALLFPLAVLLVVLLTVTEEFWLIAVEISAAQLGALATALVAPVLAVLALRLRALVAERSKAARWPDYADEETRAELGAALVKVDADVAQVEALVALLRELRDEPAAAGAPRQALEQARRSLTWSVLRRLVAVVITVALGLFAYLYLIAALAIPAGVASEWSGAPVSHLELPLAGEVPADPYVAVCALLTAIATATFVSFLIVEEESSARLVSKLLEEPARHALVLGVPYVLLAPQAGAAAVDRLGAEPPSERPPTAAPQ